MNVDKPVVAIVAAVSMAVNVWLWTENNVLRERLSSALPAAHVASVAEACHDLVVVNRGCLAFSHRVKEMLDVGGEQETAAAQWARLWDREVRSLTDGAQQGGPGRSR